MYSLSNFIVLLQNALSSGYIFVPFSKNIINEQKSGICVLRHDVDNDLSAALKMAKAESKIGISATYFFMLRSPCYNLMSRQNHLYVNEIINLGHNVGLHYDQAFDSIRNISTEDTSCLIHDEASWIEKVFQISVSAVSFHQPSSVVFQEGINCGSRINTYDPDVFNEFVYVSDSNRVFPLLENDETTENNPLAKKLNGLKKLWPKNFQLLIHPMWWVYDNQTTEEVWNEVIKSNFYQMQIQLLKTERAFGKKREFKLSFS